MEGFESFVGVNFWTALLTLCNMIITFLVLKKFLFKPVKKMIDDRQQEIDGLYADASHAKTQAEALQAQYDARLKAANAE
ncbi:MAG: ATP synthase F0 subunit B, partial [Oscillospiraceae bacterium]